MKVFVEREFIENFEIEFSDNKHSDTWKRLYLLFTEYPYITCYLNTVEEQLNEVIASSELLTKMSDINPRICSCRDFKESLAKSVAPQTLVFTETKKDWFNEFSKEPILFFSYEDFEGKLSSFINKTHMSFDLADEFSKFEWDYFAFISHNCNIILLSDPYILTDRNGQKIKDNLLILLKENLNPTKLFKIFIITELSENNLEEKLNFLNSSLAKYRTKIYLINRIKEIENMVFHDRLLYTNYTITASPAGFNIRTNKPVNSEVTTSSIFDKYTYVKYMNHLIKIKKYVERLQRYNNNKMKLIPSKGFDEFQNLNFT